MAIISHMPLATAREVVNSLRSLYPLSKAEEEAIIALTTPKYVDWKEEGEDDRADYYPYCPNCGEELDNQREKCACCHCGQLLDWSNDYA